MKLIILDRDGVINFDSDEYIKSPEEWIPIPGSLEAISRLNKAGYIVTVATNQSGIARNYYTVETLEAMHEKMANLLMNIGGHVEAILFCPHGPDDNCQCRKPKPGMLLDIARRFNTSLADSFFVGDTLSDMLAAENAGCQFALLRTGKGSRVEQNVKKHNAEIPVFDDLSAFVDWYL